MFSRLHSLALILGFTTLIAGCGRDPQTAPRTPVNDGIVPTTAAQNEWKYECRSTLLSGYQWVYVGTASRAEAGAGYYFCYGYSSLNNFCTEVRAGGVFGAVKACNLGHLGRVAYTWNRW